jgi:hypothetical protein
MVRAPTRRRALLALLLVSVTGCESTKLCAPCDGPTYLDSATLLQTGDAPTSYRICHDGDDCVERPVPTKAGTGRTWYAPLPTGQVRGLRVTLLRGATVIRETASADVTVPSPRPAKPNDCTCQTWLIRYDTETRQFTLREQ